MAIRHKRLIFLWLTSLKTTGVYYEACALFLFKAGFDVAVVLPNKAESITGLGLRSKRMIK